MKCRILGHLAQCVKDWGPIWAYSCFQFEGMNHQIKWLFHGSRKMSEQVRGILFYGEFDVTCTCVGVYMYRLIPILLRTLCA